MKKNIIYLMAAVIVGTIVCAIMYWLFHFTIDESITFGIIAASVESVITLGKRIFIKSKKQRSA